MQIKFSQIKKKAVGILLGVMVWSTAAVSTATTRESDETTIRNAGKQAVHYTIKPVQTNSEPAAMLLNPGKIHRYPGGKTLDITFQQGSESITYELEPGMHYSFRRNDQGEWELYEGSHGREDVVDLAPYVQTPLPVVEKMLSLAHVGPHDVVFDLGCGDGRIIITAAQKFGARGVGIDIIPERIQESRDNARSAGVEDQVEFRLEDATTADISPATVVTLYLIPESNELLRPHLERQLKTGTYVISHGYPISGWERKLEDLITMEVGDGDIHLIYLYRR